MSKLAVEENPLACAYEDMVIQTIRQNTNQTIVQTPYKTGALFDGFFVKDSRITSIFETKYWKASDKKDANLQYEGWFIDKHKLEGLVSASKMMCVPAYLFSGYRDTVYVFKLVDGKANILVPVVHKTKSLPYTTMGSDKRYVDREVVCISLEYAIRKLKNPTPTL